MRAMPQASPPVSHRAQRGQAPLPACPIIGLADEEEALGMVGAIDLGDPVVPGDAIRR